MSGVKLKKVYSILLLEGGGGGGGVLLVCEHIKVSCVHQCKLVNINYQDLLSLHLLV